ncbi:hypothetical protein CAPTEDRAFT_79203, partial [Capitella teleta]
WSKLPPLITPRWQHSSAYHQHNIYIIGGKNRSQALPSVECLDLVTRSWSVLPALPVALQSPFVVFVSNRLFVLGGITVAMKGSLEVYEYNFERRVWQSRRSMPE